MTLVAATAVLGLPQLTIWHGSVACTVWVVLLGRGTWPRLGSAGLRAMPRMMRSSRGSSRSAKRFWMSVTHVFDLLGSVQGCLHYFSGCFAAPGSAHGWCFGTRAHSVYRMVSVQVHYNKRCLKYYSPIGGRLVEPSSTTWTRRSRSSSWSTGA